MSDLIDINRITHSSFHCPQCPCRQMLIPYLGSVNTVTLHGPSQVLSSLSVPARLSPLLPVTSQALCKSSWLPQSPSNFPTCCMCWKRFAWSTSLTPLLFSLSCRQYLWLKTPSCPATASRGAGLGTNCSYLDKLPGKVPGCCSHLLLTGSLCCCPRNQSHKPRSCCSSR